MLSQHSAMKKGPQQLKKTHKLRKSIPQMVEEPTVRAGGEIPDNGGLIIGRTNAGLQEEMADVRALLSGE
jgi:hypothetical protein